MQMRAHLLLKPVSAAASMTACSASHGGFIPGGVKKWGTGIAGCGTTITLGKLLCRGWAVKLSHGCREKAELLLLRLCVTGPRSLVVALLLLCCIRLRENAGFDELPSPC